MADFIFLNSYLILLCPLLSFVVIGLGHLRSDNTFVGKFAITLSALSCGYALITALTYFIAVMGHGHGDVYPAKMALDSAWLNFSPTLTANMGIYLDPISVMMLIVVSVISLLVNIYSVGYMKGDPSFNRFFSLLALFSFSMLGLVVSSNILQMFVFWELVGVSSYALIGFWYEKPSAVAASKKAFIMTRFADAFFLLGILLVSFQSGSFSFQILNSPETAALLNKNFLFAGMSINMLTLGTLLIFCGGWGKSAMFPLHVWLPDAMEGPTPVSSIIHSATMVVAGVYLTARMFPLFAASESTLFVIQCIGAFTALFAAVIAITQMDIKRILAFSTLSQLGYMIFSLGAAKVCGDTGYHGPDVNPLGYSAAMYHVFTHAFFKCMLFLGAGAIIHAVHSNDILKMGGLKSLMPKTYWSLLAACLAIAGVFPLSGFWSKDAILLASLQSGHYITFLVGLITGALTAFYMFRFFFFIFHGEARSELHDVHEDPWMTWPIIILTIPTLFAGLLEHFFITHVVPPQLDEAAHFVHPGWLPWIATLAAVLGIGSAWLLYGKGKTEAVARLKDMFGSVYTLVYNKFYVDEVWLFITHKILFNCIAAPIKWFDRKVVDGSMDLTGWLLQVGGKGIRFSQNGQLQFYLGVTLVGVFMFFFLG